jgi:hypothetical protein
VKPGDDDAKNAKEEQKVRKDGRELVAARNLFQETSEAGIDSARPVSELIFPRGFKAITMELRLAEVTRGTFGPSRAANPISLPFFAIFLLLPCVLCVPVF